MALTTTDAVAAITRHSELDVGDIQLLGSGMDSVAFLVNGEWVFRFPVVPAAQATLQRELALLPRLQAHLSLAIPTVEHVGRQGDQLVFAGYRKLPGSPLSAERFDALAQPAQEHVLAAVTGFLQELQAFSVSEAANAGVKAELLNGAYNIQQRHLHTALSSMLTAGDVAHLESIFAAYTAEPANDFVPALLHADIKPDHVMYDTARGEVTAIIDWGDSCLGDPDFDLTCPYLFYSPQFARRLLAHLPDRDPDRTLAKVQFFVTVRWLQDLTFGVRCGDADFVATCVRGLQQHLGQQR